MRAFLIDFQERKRHVRNYLAIVSKAERDAGLGANRIKEGRLLTLRGGAFLVLYNLIEATTRGAIEAIHDGITTEGVRFSSLTVPLRKEAVRLYKKGADPDKHHTHGDFPAAFVAIALAQEIDFSGNVDARLIRDLGESYGFSCQTTGPTRGGSDLLTVKSNRNDLAHGRKTFEQVGRDYTYVDLLSISGRSMAYMSEILANIDQYMNERCYLEQMVV